MRKDQELLQLPETTCRELKAPCVPNRKRGEPAGTQNLNQIKEQGEMNSNCKLSSMKEG